MTLDDDTTPSGMEDLGIETDGDALASMDDDEPLEMNVVDEDEDVEDLSSMSGKSLQLEADLAAAKVEVAEWHERYLRKAAEFDNYRKRAEREKSDLRVASQGAILQTLLPMVDGFDRAMQYFAAEPEGAAAANPAASVARYREGVELLHRQVLEALAQAGATPIETEGREFDPNLHEALSREMTTAVEEGTIVKELRRGYMFNGKLLRPAQVIVAVPPTTSGN
ncbi:MAG: nucleotide exchange factor GrpE [Acidobacteriota bacterium]|jgi:molecular chaperone GrpE|nr:nucleotide exchange factor GrpE [Acidobacteriota bacterium]